MIERQPLGRTGHASTRIIFGGAALRSAPQGEADQVLELLLEHAINHIDVAPSYGDAELRIGPWMERCRSDFFLATKTLERTRDEAWAELNRSLERLRVQHLDLWQMHNLTNPDEWEVAMGPDGVLQAAIEAREQGLVRFLGVTGHGFTAPAMHRRSVERFDFDSVLLPYNYVMMQTPQYASDFEALTNLCRERQVAVQTIKAIARRPWGDQPRSHGTWYQPLDTQTDIDTAVHWVLAQSDVFLVTASDTQLLPRILDAATRFRTAPSDRQVSNLTTKTQMLPIFDGSQALW
jgi:aryl-alcohol dehydrogenase-like predicted oxidoreductase